VANVRHSDALSFGQPEHLERALGLTPALMVKLGSICAMAGSVELRLEMAVWAIGQDPPTDAPHRLDGRPITEWIKALDVLASNRLTGDFQDIARLWVAAAAPAFRCRNSILHGIAVRLGVSDVTFHRNPKFLGKRKRDSSEFTANEYSMDMMRKIFAVLLRGIFLIQKMATLGDGGELNFDIFHLKSALRQARSVAGEYDVRMGYNPHNPEKY
jgi:hypothetical protein